MLYSVHFVLMLLLVLTERYVPFYAMKMFALFAMFNCGHTSQINFISLTYSLYKGVHIAVRQDALICFLFMYCLYNFHEQNFIFDTKKLLIICFDMSMNVRQFRKTVFFME